MGVKCKYANNWSLTVLAHLAGEGYCIKHFIAGEMLLNELLETAITLLLFTKQGCGKVFPQEMPAIVNFTIMLPRTARISDHFLLSS